MSTLIQSQPIAINTSTNTRYTSASEAPIIAQIKHNLTQYAPHSHPPSPTDSSASASSSSSSSSDSHSSPQSPHSPAHTLPLPSNMANIDHSASLLTGSIAHTPNANQGMNLAGSYTGSVGSLGGGGLSFGSRFYPGVSPGQVLNSLDPNEFKCRLSSSVDSDNGYYSGHEHALIRALSGGIREDEFCRDYTCCGLPLTDLHALIEHFEDTHVVVVDHQFPPPSTFAFGMGIGGGQFPYPEERIMAQQERLAMAHAQAQRLGLKEGAAPNPHATALYMHATGNYAAQFVSASPTSGLRRRPADATSATTGAKENETENKPDANDEKLASESGDSATVLPAVSEGEDMKPRRSQDSSLAYALGSPPLNAARGRKLSILAAMERMGTIGPISGVHTNMDLSMDMSMGMDVDMEVEMEMGMAMGMDMDMDVDMDGEFELDGGRARERDDVVLLRPEVNEDSIANANVNASSNSNVELSIDNFIRDEDSTTSGSLDSHSYGANMDATQQAQAQGQMQGYIPQHKGFLAMSVPPAPPSTPVSPFGPSFAGVAGDAQANNNLAHMNARANFVPTGPSAFDTHLIYRDASGNFIVSQENESHRIHQYPVTAGMVSPLASGFGDMSLASGAQAQQEQVQAGQYMRQYQPSTSDANPGEFMYNNTAPMHTGMGVRNFGYQNECVARALNGQEAGYENYPSEYSKVQNRQQTQGGVASPKSSLEGALYSRGLPNVNGVGAVRPAMLFAPLARSHSESARASGSGTKKLERTASTSGVRDRPSRADRERERLERGEKRGRSIGGAAINGNGTGKRSRAASPTSHVNASGATTPSANGSRSRAASKARNANGGATSPTDDSFVNADGEANDIQSQLANIPGADGIANANLILLGLSKQYKCPKPGCMKSYKQANGLKYHMTHGSCSFTPPVELASVAGLSEREAEKKLKPFCCQVPPCQRRYKNMNGLRYHYQHSGEHGAAGLALLASGNHDATKSQPSPPSISLDTSSATLQPPLSTTSSAFSSAPSSAVSTPISTTAPASANLNTNNGLLGAKLEQHHQLQQLHAQQQLSVLSQPSSAYASPWGSPRGAAAYAALPPLQAQQLQEVRVTPAVTAMGQNGEFV